MYQFNPFEYLKLILRGASIAQGSCIGNWDAVSAFKRTFLHLLDPTSFDVWGPGMKDGFVSRVKSLSFLSGAIVVLTWLAGWVAGSGVLGNV